MDEIHYEEKTKVARGVRRGRNWWTSGRYVEVAELSDFEDANPSRKAAKTTRFATPGQTDRSKNAGESLPTPDTGGHALGVASGSRSRLSRGDSPPPQLEDAIILRNERKSSDGRV
jgi:hypothetical protein